jgi:hypothetical protein
MQKTPQKREYNPFRQRFNKLAVSDQLRVVKLFVKRHPALNQIVNELSNIDPIISFRQNGTFKLLTDKHLLKS